MSDLLALYIDMELKASRKSKEDHSKICTRLISCLYVYLGMYFKHYLYMYNPSIIILIIQFLYTFYSEHSIEHLLDTLVKIQFMCRAYHRILDPIMK